MTNLFKKETMAKWEFNEYYIYAFQHERHMHEFIAYIDYDSFGSSKLVQGYPYEVKLMKENIKFK